MNKKLISALLSLSMIAGGIGVLAAEDTAGSASARASVTGEMSGADVILRDIDSDNIVLAGYDEAGKLVYAQGFEVADDGTVTVPNTVLEYDLRAYNTRYSIVLDVEISEAEPTATPDPSATATPTPTATPEATEEPDATQAPTSTYNPNEFPDSYGEASVAVNAFSVIEQVSSTMNGSEQGYTIDYYYQGSEQSVWLENDIEIVSAPDSQNGVIGSDVSALKRGDVVYLNREFGGEIKEVALLYRPLSSDIVNSSEDYGTNFEELFSVNGTAVGGYSGWGVASYGSEIPSSGTYFAFGVSARRDGGTLYLLNKSGDANGAIELSLPEDVVAYRCDMTDTIGIDSIRMSQITSSIPTSTWEDAYGSDDSVIELDDTDYDYVLARVVDGTVMDIILYTY